MNFGRATLLLSSCLASTMLVATPALAQDAAGTSAKEEGGLSVITVTARKRVESAQDVPVAVTALSGAQLERRDITSIETIAAATPSLNVGRASNGSAAQITLRGIGSSSTSIGIEQSVAVVVDGAYYGQGRVIEEGFFDLARVEVLKGPQALFFGKNATAGVISIKTNDPTPNWEGYLKGGYEFKAEQYQGEGVISGPITNTLGIRIAARYSKMSGGYYRNVSTNMNYTTIDIQNPTAAPETLISTPVAAKAPQEEEFLGRVTLKWQPTSGVTDTFKVSRDQDDQLNNSWNYVAYSCGLPSGFSQLTIYPCQRDFITHQNNLPVEVSSISPYGRSDGSPYNRYRSWGVNNEFEYDLDKMMINSVTNYQWNRNSWACACNFQTTDTNAGGMIFATENSTWKAFSQELRLTSKFDGMINFMIGGLYQHTNRNFGQWGYYGLVRDTAASVNGVARPDLLYAASEKISYTSGETLAIFGQLNIKLMDNLELAGGGRYTHETKNSFFAQDYVNPAFSAVYRSATDPLGTITANQKWNNFSPEVTLTYKPSQDLMFYGAYKTAYKSGGFSNGGINSKFSPDPYGDLTFNPERARGFEFGVKSTILDNQLRANLTFFSYKVKDFQVDFFNSPVFSFNTLTADAKTTGVELELEYAPRAVPGLDVSAQLNYDDAKYASFPDGPCYSGQTQAEGCNVVLANGQIRQNLTGAPLSVAPKWTGSIGFNYETDVGSDFKVGFNGNLRYSSSYNPSGFANPIARQKEYATVDAGIRFGAADGNWQIAVVGKNLTNQFYVQGVVDGPSTGTAAGGLTGTKADQLGFGNIPRTVKVEVTKRF
ncbi:MAG: TonB-dependent receptor [Sphingomonadales bacterium]|nr:TonB-dependent receptor [Sphingomonadales bacterium]MDE2568927.1 TonB-dependent receptor [Sphingomonadales bacterium]